MITQLKVKTVQQKTPLQNEHENLQLFWKEKLKDTIKNEKFYILNYYKWQLYL